MSQPAQVGPCPYCGQPHKEDVLLCPNTEKLLPLENRILDGKFRFLRQLGEGGMGAVWKAENILVKKTVAIKLMHVQFSRNEGVLARFRNEATAAGRIGSKHICDILDLGKSELGPYIVMEMLSGSDMADFIQKRGPVDPGTLAMIMRQALVGLEAAHAVGIVHRDLKPENIFLHEPEPGRLVVKLMDFGISKFTEGSEAGKTGLGVLMGTPEYMSPEQTEGAGEVDHRTDIWAMGVIMYWALTGKNPFSGPTLAATLMNVAKGDAPSLATLTPNLPPAFIEVVARCLKRDPQQRWQSAQQLHDALAPFENLGGGLFTPMTSGPPKGATMASAHMPAGTPPPGATVAAHAGPPAASPPTPGAATWSNQLSGTPQAPPTIAGPSSWTVNDDHGRPESLAGGGNGMLIGVIAVIVIGLVAGGWALFNGMSKSDDDEVVAVADDGKAPEEGDGKGEAADGEPAGEEGDKPAEGDGGAADDTAADKTDDGAAAGEEEGGAPAEGDDGAAAEADADDGSEPAGDDGAPADDGGDDAAAGDDGDGGGSKTSGGGGTTTKPKPTKLVLVASTRVASNVTFEQAKRHCANLTDRGSSSWSLPAANQTHLIRGSHAWLSDGRIWDPARKQAAKVVGARPSRAVCVARVKA